jgi:hypothetical protein
MRTRTQQAVLSAYVTSIGSARRACCFKMSGEPCRLTSVAQSLERERLHSGLTERQSGSALQHPKWQFADVTFRGRVAVWRSVEPLRTRTTSDRHFLTHTARALGAPMNPQQTSISFLIATGHIRPMRGGAQSHMLIASDGNAYVVKFANNPQSLRVLANEWLACSIGRAIGLTIPEPAILYVPAKLVESSPSLVIQLSGSTLKCSHGMAFGSRFLSEGEVFDYLPESVLPRIDNVEEFAGAFALDKWLCNCDGRQASCILPPKIKTEIPRSFH